ncbi:MAG: DUF4832 domain-containing protein [Chloroflexota bacterium]|nr:DUF4832 domain-containing protein [Chloroflexota bacterium]
MRVPLRGWMVIAMVVGAIGPSGAFGAAARESEASPPPTELPRFSISARGDHDHQWFEVTIEAGETANLTAGIRNVGEVEATLRTFAANAVNPPNGEFAAATEEQEPANATRWLDYPSETFETQPGDERGIDFTASVPSGTPPGEYVAALVVQTAESIGIPGTETFNQIIRGTISVEITVPGDMTSGFDLGAPVVSPAADWWTLDVPITNTGTARIRPHGELIVTSANGEAVSTTRVEMSSVYGGNTTSVRVELPGHLPLGDYLVPLALTDAAAVTPNGEPVRYADVTAAITNNGSDIPTANVNLIVQRDGAEVERYPLAQNQALPQGSTAFGQRYIPVDGWLAGWRLHLPARYLRRQRRHGNDPCHHRLPGPNRRHPLR